MRLIPIEGRSPLNDLLHEVRMNLSSDNYGVCMGWLFAIADYQTDCESSEVNPEWEHSQGLGGSDTDSYEYGTLTELEPAPDVVEQLGAILWRYRDLLIATGRSY